MHGMKGSNRCQPGPYRRVHEVDADTWCAVVIGDVDSTFSTTGIETDSLSVWTHTLTKNPSLESVGCIPDDDRRR
jgi:hypothetical protein